jgi:F0F1-type ATP synthase assembly protein I
VRKDKKEGSKNRGKWWPKSKGKAVAEQYGRRLLMGTKSNKTPLKWYSIRRMKLTGEYIGGILGGFGLGILIMAGTFRSSDYWSLIMLLGLALAAIGPAIAMHNQNRYTEDFGANEK